MSVPIIPRTANRTNRTIKIDKTPLERFYFRCFYFCALVNSVLLMVVRQFKRVVKRLLQSVLKLALRLVAMVKLACVKLVSQNVLLRVLAGERF